MGHHVGYMVRAQAAHGQRVTFSATRGNACRSFFSYDNYPLLSLPPQDHVLAWSWPRLHKVSDGQDGWTGRMDADGWMLLKV